MYVSFFFGRAQSLTIYPCSCPSKTLAIAHGLQLDTDTLVSKLGGTHIISEATTPAEPATRASSPYLSYPMYVTGS